MKNKFKHTITRASLASLFAIMAYLIMALTKLYFSNLFHSTSLRSDGLNNLSDIISSLSIFIGLFIASRPPDSDHRFGHLKYEAIASFVSALLMFSIGFDLLRDCLTKIINQDFTQPDLSAIWISLLSALFLFLVRKRIQSFTAKEYSIGIQTTLTDMQNDIYISLSTALGTFLSFLGSPVIDLILSIIISFMIIKSAYDIFKESTFLLSDGFDQDLLFKYRQAILQHPKIHQVKDLRGRFY